MTDPVRVRQHLRRKPVNDFGSLRPSVPPGTRLRPSKQAQRDPVTGKFATKEQAEREPSEMAEELIERFKKQLGGDSVGAFWKAREWAEEHGADDVSEALEDMDSDDRSEPSATFLYSDREDEPKTVGSYHDDTEGEFKVEWHSTDAWRGYYEIEPADESKWKKVHDDNILAGSEDSKKLGQFDQIVRDAMDKAGIRYVRATATSSNLFSVGYDLFVEADQAERVESLINMLAPIYRDPRQYYATALTGKDPRQLTDQDVAFVNIAGIMLSKEPLENKREMLREALMRSGFDPSLADDLDLPSEGL